MFVWLVLGVMLVHAFGYVPSGHTLMRLVGRVSGERYPCENGRCGCAFAYACWTDCRCKSLAAKVLWAQKNGVEVPDYVDVGRAVSAPEPAVAVCPLCLDDPDEVGDPAGAGSSRGLGSDGCPTMSPLGCRGLELLIALASPVGDIRGAEVVRVGGCYPASPAGSPDQLDSIASVGFEPPPPRV